MDDDTVIVTYDQARFITDADVRRCWAFKGSKPIVYKNGSKKGINIGGAYSSTNEFFFYKMKYQVKEEVLWNMKLLKMKFPKLFLLLDKAAWNKNKLVLTYLENQKIPYMFFPTAAPDLNPTEQCWNKTRNDVTANVSHNSEEDLFKSLETYWRQNKFQHNVLNYLCP